jgi:hypothetical protein
MMRAWSLALCAGLVACSTAPPKQADAPEPIATDPLPDAPDPEPMDEPEDSPPAPKPSPDPGADDYQINHRDCEALARAYAGAWLNDEREILKSKKLKQAQIDKLAAELEDDSQGMFDNYLNQCSNTVGTSYLRSRLQCAAKAKTMKRFDDCMEGRADQ